MYVTFFIGNANYDGHFQERLEMALVFTVDRTTLGCDGQAADLTLKVSGQRSDPRS